MNHGIANDYTENVQSSENVKVYVRLRPPVDDDKDPEKAKARTGKLTDDEEKMFSFFDENDNKLRITDLRNKRYGIHDFLFDGIFREDSVQEDVYKQVGEPMVQKVLLGYHSCCFAYGQTGSGKTYSIFGEGGAVRGVIPRAITSIFTELQRRKASTETAVVVSFLEMYCDEIRDLGLAYLNEKEQPGSVSKELSTSEWYMDILRQRQSQSGLIRSDSYSDLHTSKKKSKPYTINEDAEGNVFVKDLSLIPVTTLDEVTKIMNLGFKLRATHETKMNAVSSRSHTVFTVTVIQKNKVTGDVIQGKLNLIDLAGSERLSKSESSGQRLREALNINSSLSALGKVVMALDPESGDPKNNYIPYRDSKLTRILQNSLGGNSYTTLLATIHPKMIHYDECLSTLHFANRCRTVRNNPVVNRVNTSGADKDKRIKELQELVAQLYRQIAAMKAQFRQRLAGIMEQLGIQGEMSESGQFVTADGRVLGMKDEEADAEIARTTSMASLHANGEIGPDGIVMAVDAAGNMIAVPSTGSLQGMPNGMMAGYGGMAAGSGMSAARYGGYGGRTQKFQISSAPDMSTESGRQIHALLVENDRICRTLDETKKNLRTKQVELNKMSRHKASQFRKHTEEIRELKNQMTNLNETTRHSNEHKNAEYESNLRSMMKNSKDLLRKYAENARQLSDRLSVDSAKLRNAKDVESRVREETDAKFASRMKAVEFGHQTEMENMRQQFEYWMKKRADETKKFVNDFNVYHEKKESEIENYKNELVNLYSHCDKLARILRHMEKGHYPVGIQSGIKTIRSKALSNTSKLFRSSKRFESLKKELEKSSKLLRGLEKPRVRPSSADVCAIPKKGLSPFGNGTRRVKSATAYLGGNTQPHITVDQDIEAKFSRLTQNRSSSTAAETNTESHVAELQEFIRSGFRENVEKQVLADLASHPTIEYIKSLEDEKSRLYKQLLNEKKARKQIRLSLQASQRLNKKLREERIKKV